MLDHISLEIQNTRLLKNTMAAQTSMLHIYVDDETKFQVTQALTAISMSMSNTVRLGEFIGAPVMVEGSQP